MKVAMIAVTALMLSSGVALAADDGDPSGRPGKVLDSDQCQAVWDMTERDGDTLSKDKAVDFVVNYEMVDTDGSGDISSDEFKAGCSKGWIKPKDGTDAE
ncbi:hypothetical protein A7A08_02424 [Methyloligella halotolerans]|uniref:EF-hand domain-containing protein n=1 Tax=Methyloligella halotolerans TaxID=1177755 RepID=A0A1E2RWL7_9HYPH|nr:hypothetical protein [Methyloligella halotolerans]ODA66656.1 hypothetical protein A7A08_02424 [Methyloligella halotolerans]